MLSQEDYRTRYAELAGVKDKVILDKDPVSGGLAFNEKIAEITSMRDRVGNMLLEAIWNRQEATQEKSTAEYVYNKSLERAIIQPDIKDLKSNDMRKAKANENLSGELERLNVAETLLSFADSYFNAVRIVSDMLKAKNENIVNQINVVRMMMNIDPTIRVELNKKNF